MDKTRPFVGNAQTDEIPEDPSVWAGAVPENWTEPGWWSPFRPLGDAGHAVSVGFMEAPDGRPIPTDLRIELPPAARQAARVAGAVPPALTAGLLRQVGLDQIKATAVHEHMKAVRVNLITRAVARGQSQGEIQAALDALDAAAEPVRQTPRRRGPKSRVPLTGEELTEISNANPGDVAGACHRAIREIAYQRGCDSRPCCQGQWTKEGPNLHCPHDVDDTHIRRLKREARRRAGG